MRVGAAAQRMLKDGEPCVFLLLRGGVGRLAGRGRRGAGRRPTKARYCRAHAMRAVSVSQPHGLSERCFPWTSRQNSHSLTGEPAASRARARGLSASFSARTSAGSWRLCVAAREPFALREA